MVTVSILRWSARILSLCSLLLVILMATDGPQWPNGREAVALLLFPILVEAGFIVAWKWEMLGGLISLGALAAFYVWMFGSVGRAPTGPYFALFTFPAVLFLAVGALKKPSKVA
jgi:hypothetical protein